MLEDVISTYHFVHKSLPELLNFKTLENEKIDIILID